MFFSDPKPSQGGAFASGLITKNRSFVSTSTSRTMHHISTGNNLFLMEIPDEQTWSTRGYTIVHEQRIVLIHVVPFGKSQSLLCAFLYRFVFSAVRPFRQTVVFPCPVQAEDADGQKEHQNNRSAAPFLFSFHFSFSFDTAVSTAKDTHSSMIST